MNLFAISYAILLPAWQSSPMDLPAIQSGIERGWRQEGAVISFRSKVRIDKKIFRPHGGVHKLLPEEQELTNLVQEVATKGDVARCIFYAHSPKYGETREDRSFDGKRLWDWREYDRMATATRGRSFNPVLCDYLGIAVGWPRSGDRLRDDYTGPFQIDQLIPSGSYRQADSEVKIQGERCIILELPQMDRLWLAIGKGYAIIRREWRWRPGATLKCVISNSDHRQAPNGLWIPWKGAFEFYGHPSRNPNLICGRVDYTMLDLQFDPDGKFFDVTNDLPAGTYVRDVMDGKNYQVGRGPQGELVKLEIEKPIQSVPWYRSFSLRRLLGNSLLWGGSGAILLVAAAVMTYKTKSSKQ